ncbi:c-type cytochrome [Massilia violaceinigra]|uniref:C-type cytochrome n=1 Tax=Massilia violaceinigra TaxID=2045208 RepID=A0ABY4A9I1_9BURK|nr:c-type cytochrome [Massilia violaceinigra]UOD31427.1 c-type cytochrome [Massilia violaceinigra]
MSAASLPPVLPPVLQSVLHPAGPDAAIISQFAWVLFGGGALVFALVIVLTALGLGRRARTVRPMAWIAGAGVAFPVAVLTVLLAWSTWRSGQMAAQTSQHATRIAVSANMWWWEVRYPNPAGGPDIVSANEIHMPTGSPVYLGLTASDVIHSLWVPALGGKMDMVPGRVTGLTLQADKPGVYRGQCAEYCGEQHARMALHVIAHAPADYAAWLARQARPAKPANDAILARGRQAFVDQRCVVCHTIRGVSDVTRLGPDLTHVGARLHIGAGTLRTHRGTLAGWIADPHSIKPGVRMPPASMDGDTLNALAAYLEQLK